MQDLRLRLGRFADAFHKDTCNVTTAEIQAWLDGQKPAPQSYQNLRRVLHAIIEFAVARGYAADNPVAVVESVKVNGGDVENFTPLEIARPLSRLGLKAGGKMPASSVAADILIALMAGRSLTFVCLKNQFPIQRQVENHPAWVEHRPSQPLDLRYDPRRRRHPGRSVSSARAIAC